MRRLLYILALLPALTMGGCGKAVLAEASVEPTGCALEDIEITDKHMPMQGPAWWTASCGGQVYFCSLLHEDVFCSTDPRDAEARREDYAR